MPAAQGRNALRSCRLRVQVHLETFGDKPEKVQ